MAKEIAILDESLAGATLYAIALAEIGVLSDYFAADFPALAASQALDPFGAFRAAVYFYVQTNRYPDATEVP